MHASCVCNEIVSATNRVLGVVPLPTARGIKVIRTQVKKLARQCGKLVPWDLERTTESFRGPRKRRYQLARESLNQKGLNRRDAKISSFVKAEKFDPAVKINPDPRMIQARDPRYNLMIAQFLRPVEHFIYNLVGPSGGRMVAKGMNQEQRAATIIENFNAFKNPVCFSLDCSRFDKHVSFPILSLEHLFYRMVLPNHPILNRLLDWQTINKCRTAGGVKYTVYGGRMSGDINTALGNCLLAILMVLSAMKILRIIKFRIYNDGDDVLVWVEWEHLALIKEQLAKTFLEFGQELKIENIARKFSDVVFCQSRVVFNGIKHVMVRDWRKVLSHACCGTRHWNDPNMVRPMFGLVGRCELALGAGLPILQEFALALQRHSRGAVAKLVNAEAGVHLRLKAEVGDAVDQFIESARARPVSHEARVSFRAAFGVELWEQEAIEAELRSWTVDNLQSTTVPPERDHTWLNYSGIHSWIPKLH